jgi:antitoxin (DNA-binding transcriptional repressor) of toxin-antitoxin stability system
VNKTVTVEELAADVDKWIGEVKNRHTLVITQGGYEIATITPANFDRGVPYPFRNLRITPLSKPLTVDPVQLLIEDRERDRSGIKFKK